MSIRPLIILDHTVNRKCFPSCKVIYKIAKCKKPHTIVEQLKLTINMSVILFGESYAKQLKKMSLSNNSICQRINYMSVDIQQQLESE